MKKCVNILITCVVVVGFAFTAHFNEPNALSWYGFDSYTTNSQYSSDYDFMGKDDQVQRKRRHRRRRKISPEKKGW